MSNKTRAVLNRTQADGDVVFFFTSGQSTVQFDVQVSATPTAGTLAVLFVTHGLSTPKQIMDANGNAIVVDLKAPYPVVLPDISISKLIFRPENFDADKTFSVGVTSSEVV
jgi:hypothetical protein